MIPKVLLQDPYWKGLIHIFMNHAKLQRYLTPEYVDFDERSVHAGKLQKASAGWSQSEKFMLRLALHLFNDIYEIDGLSDMDRLDPENRKIAFKAIQLRFAA